MTSRARRPSSSAPRTPSGLAEYRDEVAPAEDDDEEESRETPEMWEGTDEDWNDAFTGRDEAPASATLTVKTINDNRYYWQWSEDGKTKSEHIKPVAPKR